MCDYVIFWPLSWMNYFPWKMVRFLYIQHKYGLQILEVPFSVTLHAWCVSVVACMQRIYTSRRWIYSRSLPLDEFVFIVFCPWVNWITEPTGLSCFVMNYVILSLWIMFFCNHDAVLLKINLIISLHSVFCI